MFWRWNIILQFVVKVLPLEGGEVVQCRAPLPPYSPIIKQPDVNFLWINWQFHARGQNWKYQLNIVAVFVIDNISRKYNFGKFLSNNIPTYLPYMAVHFSMRSLSSFWYILFSRKRDKTCACLKGITEGNTNEQWAVQSYLQKWEEK